MQNPALEHGAGPGDASPNWLVYLDKNNNGVLDTGELFTTTGADGSYYFSDVPPGTYKVALRLGGGWTATSPSGGTGYATVPDGGGALGPTFGIAAPGTITGRVFTDTNGNGTKDGSEIYLGGRRVYVDSNNNNRFDTTTITAASTDTPVVPSDLTTIIDGIAVTGATLPVTHVKFTVSMSGVTGSFVVALRSPGGSVVQAGYSSQPAGPITIDCDDFNGETANGNWTLVVYSNTAFGFPPILNSWSLTVTSGEASAVTDVGGNYTLTRVAAGDAWVREVLPSGGGESTPGSGAVVHVASGAPAAGPTFGAFQYVNLKYQSYEDVTGNGTYNSATDPGVTGAQVKVYRDNGDGVFNASNDTLVNGIVAPSTRAGEATMLSLVPGTYFVTQTPPSGYVQTSPASPTYATVQARSGMDPAELYFGNARPGSISGTVFRDVYGSGANTQNLPLSGRVVFLDANNNGKLDTGETSTTTNALGQFTFSNLLPGSYNVVEQLPSGWLLTTPATQSVALTSGLNKPGLVFGNALPDSIAGQVFEDRNGDGQFTPGLISDRALNWSVTLTRARDGQVTTAPVVNGYYTFNNLLPGNYSLSVAPPAGWQITTPARSVVMGDNQSVPGMDFGFFQKVTVSGQLFNDTAGVTAASGATVELWKDNGDGQLTSADTRVQTAQVSAAPGQPAAYSFTGVGPGKYLVHLVPTAANVAQTSPASGGNYVVVTSSGVAVPGQDFHVLVLSVPLLVGPSGSAGLKPTFSWTAVTGADRYEISLERFDGANWQPVVSGVQVAGTTWVPSSPLTSGTIYGWKVRARAGSTAVSNWSAELYFVAS
jgi:uncharacterized protein (DUF2141 family)